VTELARRRMPKSMGKKGREKFEAVYVLLSDPLIA
jgi:hypothetical protein